MSLSQQSSDRVILEPVPEFDDIGFAGDGRYFLLQGNAGKAGMVNVPDIPQAPYNSNLTEQVDGMNYSKFYCDYLITETLKLQSADLKIKGAGTKDFAVLEVLALVNPDPETWVLGNRFVRRFYFSTDFEDQDTPTLPYAKTLESGKFIIRVAYFKHESNANDIELRVNYMLHEVAPQ